MREYLTAESVANQIRMQWSAHPGPFLLVEGDTDARFFRLHLMPEDFRKSHLYGLMDAWQKNRPERQLLLQRGTVRDEE